MKRILVALFLILSLVICLPSCDDKNDIVENPEFDRFNQMFVNGFENYTISMSTTSANGEVVNNEYVITTENGVRKVTYKTERLNGFIIENGVISTNGYKTVSEGVFDEAQSASSTFDVPKFNFSYKCIEADIITHMSFDAKITSLAEFMGLEIEADNSSFSLTYSNNSVKSISVTYTTANQNTVVITYKF